MRKFATFLMALFFVSVVWQLPVAPEPHIGGVSTCTEAAACTACGEAYGEPDGHMGGGTCIEDWYCEVCGNYVGVFLGRRYVKA